MLGVYVYRLHIHRIYDRKLLANDYSYDKGRTVPEGQLSAVFLTMKTIATSTDTVADYLQSGEIALTHQEQKGFIYFVVLHILLIILFISIFRSIVTKPGSVPLDWSLTIQNDLYSAAEAEKILLLDSYRRNKKDPARLSQTRKSVGARLRSSSPITEQEPLIKPQEETLEVEEGSDMMKEISNLAYYNAMKKDNRRFCTYCRLFKPERTHHCQQCDTCVLKMDHHCPWIDNCVGFRNYKYFFNMTFYAVITLWFVVATYMEAVIDTLFNVEIDIKLSFWIFFTFGVAVVLTLVITGFLFFHIWLIIRGKTTLEFLEKKKSGDYNLGCWENTKMALGSDFTCWLLPTAPYFKTDGLEFNNKLIENNL